MPPEETTTTTSEVAPPTTTTTTSTTVPADPVLTHADVESFGYLLVGSLLLIVMLLVAIFVRIGS